MKESGRSMVEMLGVLAVIGVLSIGGIAGYRTAMDYYQANEIIDSVSKAATQLSVGLVAGTAGKTLTLDETTTTNGYDMAAAIDAPGTFVVQVQGVTKSVCENILNRDWELPLEMTAECADSTNMDFVFANDLSDEATVMVTPGFDADKYKGCQNDEDCGDGLHCGYGVCIAEEDYCEYDYFAENGCQGKDPDRPHCLNYRCVAGCTSDRDCENMDGEPYCLTFRDYSGASRSMCVECTTNEHCNAGSSGKTFYCSGIFESCTESSYNRCEEAKIGSSYTASDGKTYYLSPDILTWWNADNYCKVLGKSLVPADILNTKGVDGSKTWDNGTNKTALVGELYTGFGSPSEDWVWTATDWSTSSSSSSKTCFAYYVRLSDGNLSNNTRVGYCRALCWDGGDNYNPNDYLPMPETTELETTNH